MSRPTVLELVLACVEAHPWATAGEIVAACRAAHGGEVSRDLVHATLRSAYLTGYVARAGVDGGYRWSIDCIPQDIAGLGGLLTRIHGDTWHLHSHGHGAHAVTLWRTDPAGQAAATAIYADARDALRAALSLVPVARVGAP